MEDQGCVGGGGSVGRLICWTNTDDVYRASVIEKALAFVPHAPSVLYAAVEDKVPWPQAGDVMLAMGAKCLPLLAGQGYVPKNRTVNSLRGTKIPVSGMTGTHLLPSAATVFCTFDPYMTQVEESKYQEIAWDIQLACRYLRTGSTEPELGLYEWTDTLKYVIAYVKQKYAETKKPVDLSLDLETEGLLPWYSDKKIVSVSFTPESGYSDVVYLADLSPKQFKVFLSHMRWLLSSPLVSLKGANLKFDLIWIAEKWSILCTNFKFDTLSVGSLVDENRSNSLNMHAKVYTSMGGYDDEFNSKHDKGHMELVPKDDLLKYAGGDTDAAHRTYHVLRDVLMQDVPLKRFYVRILHPAIRAFEKVERRGVLVDQEAYADLALEVQDHIEKIEAEAIAMMPRKLRLKYAEDLTLSRPVILKDFMFSKQGLGLKPRMFTAKTGAPSTARDHFMLFEDVPEAMAFLELFKEWGSARKTMSTYITGFLEHLRPDGRFHPTYMLFAGSMFEGKDDDAGTNTGRTSAKNPAIQTLPKKTKWAKKLRRCYIAPPGHVVFQFDFSQGELRIAACLAQDEVMLEAYKNGVDLHALTGSKLAGYEYEEFMALLESDPDLFEKFRGRAKPANFGLLYGMKGPGYREYARTGYNLKMSAEEAEGARDAFFELYSGLLPWHDAAIATARNQGYIRNPLGRVRHLPLINVSDSNVRSHAERQAINAPVQSCLSDMTLWAIAILDRMYGDQVPVVGMTHDSIYGYLPEDQVDVMVPRIRQVMENLPFEQVGWKPQLKFAVDAEVGDTMATLKKVA